jgi:hypothetical protein
LNFFPELHQQGSFLPSLMRSPCLPTEK